MEHISTEEFLKQPNEIQKIFLDWWKQNVEWTDLIGYIGETPIYKKNSPWITKGVDLVCLPIGKETIPLFTEGQLRKFIENKIDGKMDIVYSSDTEFQISFWKFQKYGNDYIGSQEIRANDLLQAYWQVALQIVKDKAN